MAEFEITPEEFEKAQKMDESAALSDDELEAVAGGISLSSETKEKLKSAGQSLTGNLSKITEEYREAMASGSSVKESIADSVTASLLSPDKFF